MVGDKVTASPIAGVGMKASESSVVVGTAQANLNTKPQSDIRTITDKKGRKQTIRVGLIPVQVGVAFYTASASASGASLVPPYLQRLANSISGRDVSPIRVISATLVLLIVLITVASISFSAIRSSMISIGRNPLSE
jgi:hypothetical protein